MQGNIFPLFPRTRYQGSKYKIVDWIIEGTKSLEFNTILDAFGGTGVVGYNYKLQGKNVIYNDLLKFNSIIGKALIENQGILLEEKEVNELLKKSVRGHNDFIQNVYKNVFFLDYENAWLDDMVYKISNIQNPYKRAIAWFAVIQSCIIKRPYNLFHRANLATRTAQVNRTFGNKTTWDKPFDYYFKKFVMEANMAVFNSGGKTLVLNQDATTIDLNLYKFDAVYIDTPYISNKGIGTDYLDFYGFLEGLVNYNNWDSQILYNYKHKPLKGKGNKSWTGKNEIYYSFDKLFKHYKDKKMIISYRNDGIPAIDELIDMLNGYKKYITKIYGRDYKYVLSKKQSKEMLIIAQ